MPKAYGQSCPVAKALEVVGDRWTLLLVRDLLGGARRFQDLQAAMPGMAPNILSGRLKLMEEHGLVTRQFYSEHPPRAEYLLTDRGRELGTVVGALAAWGARHVYPEVALVHADCGHPVELKYFCARCADRVSGRAVAVRGVPAARRAGGRAAAPAGVRPGGRARRGRP
jgi:DNA-binding HxlR family transcriptional regulator